MDQPEIAVKSVEAWMEHGFELGVITMIKVAGAVANK